ncbi:MULTISPECIES: hypothetical protein [unclassified Nocardiopsis]|uniref:hypothetical protein n=1 Tax=Nocardiopsis TaxID=2013 RepID=UPI00387B84AE
MEFPLYEARPPDRPVPAQRTPAPGGAGKPLDEVPGFAARQDSRYADRGADGFDVSAALAVARATGLARGCRARARPAGTGRP